MRKEKEESDGDQERAYQEEREQERIEEHFYPAEF